MNITFRKRRHRLFQAVFQAAHRLFKQRFLIGGDNSPGNGAPPVQELFYFRGIETERLSIVIGVKTDDIDAGIQQKRPVGIPAAVDAFQPPYPPEYFLQQAG